jgi:endoglucanase
MDPTTTFLKELVEAHGAPGFEGGVATVMEKYLKGVGPMSRDRLGSFICEKKGTKAGPRVMLAGHLDEVGFLVKSVTREGYIKFLPLGGWWGHVVLAQRLLIKTRKGDVLGVVGSKPPHELRDEDRKKVLEIKDMYIDVGATSDWDEEEARHPPRRSDRSISTSPMANPNLLCESVDNRIGCALAAETAKRLQGVAHLNTVFAVATVQEEVGSRRADFGVQGAARRGPCARRGHRARHARHGGRREPGGGPLIVVYDATSIPNRGLPTS